MGAEIKNLFTQHREFIDKPFRLNSTRTYSVWLFFAEIEFIFMSKASIPFILFSFIQAKKKTFQNT